MEICTELDRAFLFSELISEQTRQGVQTPVVNALVCVDATRKQNLLRKWELAVIEETMDMKQDELDTFLQKMKTYETTKSMISLKRSNHWIDDDNDRTILGVFQDENAAIDMFYNKYQHWFVEVNLYNSSVELIHPKDADHTNQPITRDICRDIILTRKIILFEYSDTNYCYFFEQEKTQPIHTQKDFDKLCTP